jgi:twinkle protein
MYAEELGVRDHVRIQCKVCSNDRSKASEQCVSVDRKGDWVVWNCHHCGDGGAAPLTDWKPKKAYKATFAVDVNAGIKDITKEYLSIRGISEDVWSAANIFSVEREFRTGKQDAIAFPNIVDGKVVGVKYRGLNKEFSQEAGSAQVLWGQSFATPPVLIITEGEMDALSCRQAGLNSSVSVPSGAPMRVSEGKIDPSEDRKFGFVWEAKAMLESMEKVILAVDNDDAGQALQEELARRIGKAKCWTVKYPEGCKDLNDVLVRHGVEEVKNVINNSEPFPINGLFGADNYFDSVDEKYLNGQGKGVSTGYECLNELYTIVPGQLSVVTGWPSSGKSNFVDQVCVNLAKQKDWRFMMASFENPPEEHIIKLCEIFLSKPFYNGPTTRMTSEELNLAKAWVKDHFLFLDVANGGTGLESILQRAQAAVGRIGIRGMVIDPYNYIDIERTGTETENINHMLTRVNAFAKSNDVHTWFVAHPAKMQREGTELPVPDGMAISGSMSWWAKADVGLTVHRRQDDVMVKVWKARWRWVGKLGMGLLHYDIPTGTYAQPPF